MKLRKGFTLIELLVVIAIIGVLATIVITKVGNAKVGANNAKIKSDMSSIHKAANLHRANGYSLLNITDSDNDGFFSDADIQQFISSPGNPIIKTAPKHPLAQEGIGYWWSNQFWIRDASPPFSFNVVALDAIVIDTLLFSWDAWSCTVNFDSYGKGSNLCGNPWD